MYRYMKIIILVLLSKEQVSTSHNYKLVLMSKQQ